jgi:hypothetical protein
MIVKMQKMMMLTMVVAAAATFSFQTRDGCHALSMRVRHSFFHDRFISFVGAVKYTQQAPLVVPQFPLRRHSSLAPSVLFGRSTTRTDFHWCPFQSSLAVVTSCQ